jgi:uncharacterized protein
MDLGVLKGLARLSGAMSFALVLAGCAGYNAKVTTTMDALKAGSVDAALADLEKNNTDKEKDLLYHFEKGELLRMKGDYAGSINSWSQADAKIQEWENAVRTDPSKLAGDIGSFIVNDTMRRYDGRDYEKVLLSVRLAQDYIAQGKWDEARVEIKKMHEREAIISEFRAKELEDARKEAEGSGIAISSPKEINGYPIESLEAPEVKSLKNAYESAVANYLAGFVYEALGEPSLAAAGYRKAIEMRGNSPILEDALKNLDDNSNRSLSAGVDTLIIVETGNAPVIESLMLPIPLPIPSRNGLGIVMTPLSWPLVKNPGIQVPPPEVTSGTTVIPLEMITSVDHMARRAIADEMPGIIARSAVRAVVKGATQAALRESGSAGSILALIAGVAAVATEQADERTWRTLPNAFSVGRAILPFGPNKLTFQTASGPVTRDVQLSGKYSLVTLRTSGGSVFLAQAPFDPLLEPPKVEPPKAEPPKAIVKKGVKSAMPAKPIPAAEKAATPKVAAQKPEKKSLLATFLVTGALLAGQVGAQTIASKMEYLGEATYVQIPGLTARERNGLLALQMEVQNTDNEPRRVFWRIKWLDDSGFQVWEDEPWKPLLLQAKARQNVQVSAPTPKARDFRIQMNAQDNSNN